MGTVKSRFDEILNELGVKFYSLETTCEGITKSMLQNLKNSPTDTITSNILEPFCKAYPTVSCEYLLRGTGTMFLDQNEDNVSIEHDALQAELADLREENRILKAQLSHMKDPNLKDKNERIYNIWMKFMDVTAEMQELYKEDKEG